MGGTKPKRNRQRGKEAERAIAKRVGGKRVGILGNEDVEHPVYSIEVKSYARFAGAKVLEQAERNAPKGKVPIAVVHVRNQQHENDIVMVRFKDLFIKCPMCGRTFLPNEMHYVKGKPQQCKRCKNDD